MESHVWVPVASESTYKDQLLPLSLGYPLRGLYSLGTHAYRAPHNGSASAPTGPWLSTLSTYSDQHASKKARMSSQELPRRIGSGVTGASLQCTEDKAAPPTMPPQ